MMNRVAKQIREAWDQRQREGIPTRPEAEATPKKPKTTKAKRSSKTDAALREVGNKISAALGCLQQR